MPLALALYVALRGINRNVMLVAAAFVMLFVVLDLPLTWANLASLMDLSDGYAAASTEAQRAVFAQAAMYPSSVLASGLLFVYNTLTLSVGILLTGVVMLKGIFSRTTAHLAVATGLLGIVSVAGSFFTSALDATIIFASTATTLWVMFAGYRLYRLGAG